MPEIQSGATSVESRGAVNSVKNQAVTQKAFLVLACTYLALGAVIAVLGDNIRSAAWIAFAAALWALSVSHAARKRQESTRIATVGTDVVPG